MAKVVVVGNIVEHIQSLEGLSISAAKTSYYSTTTILWYGTGLVGSLLILVRGSYNYMSEVHDGTQKPESCRCVGGVIRWTISVSVQNFAAPLLR